MTPPPATTAWHADVVTRSPEETGRLATAIAGLCRPGDVVLLVGGLGAGKTTFVQGFAGACGVSGPITSPTFALVRQYPVGVPGPSGLRELLHADVYRLDSLADIADLGLAELVEDGAVLLVEWGDRAAPLFGEDVVVVTLAPLDATGGEVPPADVRRVTVEASGPTWAGRTGALACALAPFLAGAGGPR